MSSHPSGLLPYGCIYFITDPAAHSHVILVLSRLHTHFDDKVRNTHTTRLEEAFRGRSRRPLPLDMSSAWVTDGFVFWPRFWPCRWTAPDLDALPDRKSVV